MRERAEVGSFSKTSNGFGQGELGRGGEAEEKKEAKERKSGCALPSSFRPTDHPSGV